MSDQATALQKAAKPFNLKTPPFSISKEEDWEQKNWPKYVFTYRYMGGSLEGVGKFISDVALDLEANGAVTEAIRVTNMARMGSLTFGSASLDQEWIAFVSFTIQPGSQTQEVQRRMREHFDRNTKRETQ